VLSLITRMESQGLLVSGSEGVSLTPEGERVALQVVRAHRLLERYLADEAGLPMARLHQAAERGEHELSPEGVDRLDAHLGHPQRDPHGDPIPTREGELPHLEATTLTDWAPGRPARIVHVEDEPAVIFEQIVAAGLRPGMTVWILEKTPERLTVSAEDAEIRLALAVAANIQVTDASADTLRDSSAVRLSALPFAVRAEVVRLDDECRGFSRRRLMDLGMTPGAIVQPALENTFGDPRAYRLRGTTIALRKLQSSQVWVRPLSTGRKAAA
jgi:DtxR family transcriptional regulator, Mn-dependent transcriptional regulator